MVSSRNLLEIANLCEKVGLLIALFSNSTLLLLLFFKSSKKFGAYKYLMISYTLIEMLYSVVATSASMKAHSTSFSYVVFRNYNGPNRTVAPIFLVQFCAMIVSLLLVLSVHFIYRYIAISRTHLLHLFQGFNILVWIFCALGLGIFSASMKYFFLGENEYSTELLRQEFMDHYGLTMEEVVYNGPTYHFCNSFREQCSTPPTAILTIFLILGSLISCFCLMTVFGYKCYTALTSQNTVMSAKTAYLHNQLLVALLIQSVIPIFFMYVPLVLLFTLPVFGIGVGAYANITMASLAIYPPLDQLAIIYVIRDFREAIFRGFGCGKAMRVRISSISATSS